MTEIEEPTRLQMEKVSRVLRVISERREHEERKMTVEGWSLLIDSFGEPVWPNHTHVSPKDVEVARGVIAGARPTEEERRTYENAMDERHPGAVFDSVLGMMQEEARHPNGALPDNND